jgi:hypothetical protein
MKGPDCAAWKEVEKKEVENMLCHEVWVERPRRPDDCPIASTWVYRRKLGSDNQVVEYKARICAQGFRQTLGINFDQKYAPTGKAALLRLLISFILNCGLQIHQLDVRSSFLTCPLKEKVTLFPPPGFQCAPGTIFDLRKAIYGLKQASLAWYDWLKAFLHSIGFSTAAADPCVFYRPDPPNQPATWVFAHVDDLVIISADPLKFKVQMESEFDIKYLGQAAFLLGMNIKRMSHHLHIHQTQYVKRKLLEYGFEKNPIASCPLDPKVHLRAATTQEMDEFQKLGVSYRALIGSLNYLAVLTRPDVAFAVSVLLQHLEKPGIQHY